MSTTFLTAVNGINQAVARATQSASNVVNASSTGADIAKNLVDIKVASVEVAANAMVIKAQKKMQESLLDIKV